MSITFATVVLGTLLMAQADDVLHIEPGKQLPQTLTVHAGDKSSPHDVTIHYLLFVPQDYKPTGEKWPLILFLHGYGECGNNELDRVKIHGPPKLVETKPDFPFVLVSPQCPPPGSDLEKIGHAWKPDELLQLIDHVASKLNVDPERVYVTGLSMGGYGTWRLAATFPERFAAAVPICGGGEPAPMAAALSHVPIWAFHGAKDTTVPLSESKNMVYHARKAGGDARLTIYPEAGHNCWEQTYNNQEVYDWLLAHRRKEKPGTAK